MKEKRWLFLAVAVLFLAGCGEETQKQAAEATAKSKEVLKEASESVKKSTEEVKKKSQKLIEKGHKEIEESSKNLTEVTKEKAIALAKVAKKEAAIAAEALTKQAAETTKIVQSLADEAFANKKNGEVLYAKCTACHGKDGKTKALGKSAVIAGQNVTELKLKLKAYKKGERDVSGQGTLMKQQVFTLTDEQLKDLAAYISTMNEGEQ